jgi:hypothetical protein
VHTEIKASGKSDFRPSMFCRRTLGVSLVTESMFFGFMFGSVRYFVCEPLM